jgi:hypothetical protein
MMSFASLCLATVLSTSLFAVSMLSSSARADVPPSLEVLDAQSKLYPEDIPDSEFADARGLIWNFTYEFDPRSILSGEYLRPFRLLIYVNKAPSGATAQQARVFSLQDGVVGPLLFQWPVSTGREDAHQMTPTPTGIFTLDSHRFVPWPSPGANKDMKWAMYWDYRYVSRLGGYALHTAPPGTEGLLGYRASHGCVRMPYEKAEMLFHFIQNGYGGPVPFFPFDSSQGHTSRTGEFATNGGQLAMHQGYQVLLVIYNDPSEQP